MLGLLHHVAYSFHALMNAKYNLFDLALFDVTQVLFTYCLMFSIQGGVTNQRWDVVIDMGVSNELFNFVQRVHR